MLAAVLADPYSCGARVKYVVRRLSPHQIRLGVLGGTLQPGRLTTDGAGIWTLGRLVLSIHNVLRYEYVVITR
jgi:hypothetical protein